MRGEKLMQRLLVVLLAISFLLMIAAFVIPVHARPSQPDGWDCYGYVCWEAPICGYFPNTHWYCTNYCQSVPGGSWACLGVSGCQNGC